MKRMLVCSALLALCASPAMAGTVYVPLLSGNGIDDSEYVTRVWLTNEGNGPQKVETLVIPMNTDGTAGRDKGPKPNEITVRAGMTSVIEMTGESGLLEITTSGDGVGKLAINAEARHTGMNPAEATHSIPPVLSSDNMAEAGDTLTLQGMRRTQAGVVTNLLLVNLGHSETQCTVKAFRAGGAQIAGTALLNLKPLSQVHFPDALEILGESQIGDVHAQVSCDEPFYSYLTLYDADGEALFVGPSVTDDSALAPPGVEVPSVPGAVLFTQNGVFHSPSPAEPTKIYNIGVPGDQTFSNVVVDFDFYHGGWYGKDPGGLHSLVWLHRGACCWPKWPRNITVFANAFGPGKNQLKMISNMDLPQYDKSRGQTNFGLQPGQTYHAHFEYATKQGVAFLEIRQNGKLLSTMTMPTTVSRLQPDQSQAWMIYFGHEDEYYSGHGAERPSYGWKYQNLRVEFIP